VTVDFAASPLVALLQARRDEARRPQVTALTERIARVYVPAVLGLAVFSLWLWHAAGWPTALDVTVAVLVVTCPCALGIAIPLSQQLAFARLRRAGVFVRNGDLLDRATGIRRVVFDKTGTLTLGRMVLPDPSVLETLQPEDRDALYDMATRSNHPVSRAIADALSVRGGRFSTEARVTELAGAGLILERDGQTWRLGKRSWAVTAPTRRGLRPRAVAHEREDINTEVTTLSRNGAPIAILSTREATRSDAREEIRQLKAQGVDVWLLSGDAPDRVSETAAALAILPQRVRAGMSPEEKAQVVKDLDHGDTLFIGDGVNDSLAFSVATACGTPAIDRPVMPARSDFFLLGENIAGVRRLLETSQLLRATMRRILMVAVSYNALSIVLCLMGVMTPLRAAVAMPASSLAVIFLAMAGFSQRTGPSKAATIAAVSPEVVIA
jgi:Cu2+-exporting ATPase